MGREVVRTALTENQLRDLASHNARARELGIEQLSKWPKGRNRRNRKNLFNALEPCKTKKDKLGNHELIIKSY